MTTGRARLVAEVVLVGAALVLGVAVASGRGAVIAAGMGAILVVWAASTGSAASLVGLGIGWLPFVAGISIVSMAGLPDVTVQRVFVLVLVLVLSSRVSRDARDGVTVAPALRNVGVVLAVGCVLLLQAAVRSSDPGNAVRFLLDAYVLPTVAFSALAAVRWSPEEVMRAIAVAAAGVMGWVGIAAYEVATGRSVLSGIDYQALGRGYVRPAGPFTNPAALGWLLGAMMVVMLGVYLSRRRSPYLLAASAACAIGVAMTLTRSAWLATLVGCVFVLVALGRRSRFQTIGVAALTAGSLALAVSELGAGSFLARLSTEGTVLNRFAVWATAFRLFERNPLFGIGLGMYGSSSQASLSGIGGIPASYAANIMATHNSLLLLLVEGGFFAAVAFVAGLIMLHRLGRTASKAQGHWASVCFQSVLIVSVITGSTVDVQLLSRANVVVAILMGVLIGASGTTTLDAKGPGEAASDEHSPMKAAG
jgi:O-antigen ligase